MDNNLGQPAAHGVSAAAVFRLVDGRWQAMNKDVRNNFICATPFQLGMNIDFQRLLRNIFSEANTTESPVITTTLKATTEKITTAQAETTKTTTQEPTSAFYRTFFLSKPNNL